MYKLTNFPDCIQRLSDGAFIPADVANQNYIDYLDWVTQGNTPQPADVPNKDVAIQAQIDQLESQTMMIRGTRESLLAFAVAIAAASGVPESTLYAQNIAYKKMKDLDTQISALRHSL